MINHLKSFSRYKKIQGSKGTKGNLHRIEQLILENESKNAQMAKFLGDTKDGRKAKSNLSLSRLNREALVADDMKAARSLPLLGAVKKNDVEGFVNSKRPEEESLVPGLAAITGLAPKGGNALANLNLQDVANNNPGGVNIPMQDLAGLGDKLEGLGGGLGGKIGGLGDTIGGLGGGLGDKLGGLGGGLGDTLGGLGGGLGDKLGGLGDTLGGAGGGLEDTFGGLGGGLGDKLGGLGGGLGDKLGGLGGGLGDKLGGLGGGLGDTLGGLGGGLMDNASDGDGALQMPGGIDLPGGVNLGGGDKEGGGGVADSLGGLFNQRF